MVQALVSTVRSSLEPYVGAMVADTCVRATALSAGKMSDDLSSADLPAIEANIRRLLSPVAPQSSIDSMIADIKRSVVM